MQLTLNTDQLTFAKEAGKCCHLSVKNFHLPLSNFGPGVALDVIGYRELELFRHHTNTGGFLLYPLEYGKYDTRFI